MDSTPDNKLSVWNDKLNISVILATYLIVAYESYQLSVIRNAFEKDCMDPTFSFHSTGMTLTNINHPFVILTLVAAALASSITHFLELLFSSKIPSSS
jgi:hypothetical protein